MSRIKYFILFSALVLHISLILIRGYFLSIEFTLYPYLTSHGFLPYKDIIDQHFPTLLFGPFSLPSFLTSNPWPLLVIFLITLCLTDLLLFMSFIRFKVSRPFIWLVFYIVSSVYFSGNILWIETFINLLLSATIFLSVSKTRASKFVTGFLISQIILLRPTIIPAVALLYLGLSIQISFAQLLGFSLGLIIPGIYLLRFGLLSDFYRLTIIFNQQVYPGGALFLPAKRQLIMLLLWAGWPLYSLLKQRKYLFLATLLFCLTLIIPRFGFEHLQPLVLLMVFFWSLSVPKPAIGLYLFIFLLFSLSLISAIRHPYGNYFLNPDVKKIASDVQKLPGDSVYLLGASDLIYPLSGKLPPNYVYLPSLPWYFSQDDFVKRTIYAISDKNTPVLVDYSATVDGLNVVESSGPIFEYIKMNLHPGPKTGNYQIFYPNP